MIIDSCDIDLHNKLYEIYSNDKCYFSLITIGLKKVNDKRATLQVDLNNKVNIEHVVIGNFPNLYETKELEIIDKVANGNVKLALRIASKRDLIKTSEIDRICYKFYNKLLKSFMGSKKSVNEIEREVLLSLSLLEKVGFWGNQRSDYKFLANEICRIDADKFYSLCKRHFISKECLLREDDYICITPFSIKLALSGIWWYECSLDKAIRIISLVMSSQYADSFFSTIGKLESIHFIEDTFNEFFRENEFLKLFVIDNPNSLNALYHLSKIVPNHVINIIAGSELIIKKLSEQSLIEVIDILNCLCDSEIAFEQAIILLLKLKPCIVHYTHFCYESESERHYNYILDRIFIHYSSFEKLILLEKLAFSLLKDHIGIIIHLLKKISHPEDGSEDKKIRKKSLFILIKLYKLHEGTYVFREELISILLKLFDTYLTSGDLFLSKIIIRKINFKEEGVFKLEDDEFDISHPILERLKDVKNAIAYTNLPRKKKILIEIQKIIEMRYPQFKHTVARAAAVIKAKNPLQSYEMVDTVRSVSKADKTLKNLCFQTLWKNKVEELPDKHKEQKVPTELKEEYKVYQLGSKTSFQ